jgi:hypothetical protein
MPPGEAERVGEILLAEGIVTQEELSRALADGGLRGTALAAALEASPHVRKADLAAFLSADFRIPVIEDLRRIQFAEDLGKLVPEEIARKHELVPLAKIGEILCVAKGNYFNRAALNELRKVVPEGKLKVLQADELQVRSAIERIYRGRRGDLPAPGSRKPETSVARAPAPVEEVAAFEAIPLIAMPEAAEGQSRPAAARKAAAATMTLSAREEPVEEVIEIMDAVRISYQDYQTLLRDPFARLVVEFDELFQVGRPASPSRLS